MKNLELNRLFNEQIDVFSVFFSEIKEKEIDYGTLLRAQRQVVKKSKKIQEFIKTNANNTSL